MEASHQENRNRYKCTICTTSYTAKISLANHVKLKHSKTMEMKKCEVCGKDVPKNYLSSHKKQHKKPDIPCEICGRLFKTITKMKDHRQVHSASRLRFPCEPCKVDFSAKSTLENHIIRVHNSQMFTCNVCKQEFKTPSDVRQHKRIRHEQTEPTEP